MPAATEPPTLLSVFSTFAVGGAQVRYAAIANRLGPRLRHRIVALDGNTACAERLDPGLDVEFPRIRVGRRKTLANTLAFAGYLRTTRPALLVTHNWGTIEWAMARRLTGTPHIHIEDGFGPEERTTQIPRRVWTRRLVLRPSTTIVPSRTLERIARETWRLPDVRYIANGIDLARLAAPPRPPRDIPVIGTVAALRPEKNLARLLHACTRLTHDFRLVIAGDGPERAPLADLAAKLGLADRVSLPGHIPNPAPLYATFDIAAMSSDTEQMPLCVLESMGASLPVAATDVGDIAAMLTPENRPYVVPQDETALAQALDTLLANPALRQSIGTANRTRAETEFDQETMFAIYAGLFGA